jgi:hypothetical protein
MHNPETELKIPRLRRKIATSYFSDEMCDKVNLDEYCLMLKFVVVLGTCY